MEIKNSNRMTDQIGRVTPIEMDSLSTCKLRSEDVIWIA